MNRYSVRITSQALKDMEAIYDYIASELLAADAAMGQYDRIAAAVSSPDCFPNRYSLFESQPERSLGMRRMPVDNFSVIYIVEGDSVTVLRVLCSASDIISRLRGDEPVS